MKKCAGFLLMVTFFNMMSTPARSQEQGYLTYPFSQLVVRNDWAAPIVWRYKPFKDIVETETVIAPPTPGEDWTAWYNNMKAYQAYMRNHINDSSSQYLELRLKKSNNVRLTFKRVLNNVRLLPKEHIILNGFAKCDRANASFSISLIYIKKGQEQSHNIARTENLGSVSIGSSSTLLQKEIIIPSFDTAVLMVQPVVFFSADDSLQSTVELTSFTLSIPGNAKNQLAYNRLQPSFDFKSKGIDRQLYNRPEMQWVKSNYISGFAYLWDHDFWDADKKQFRVQEYCDKMQREFGGFQSVLIWIGYPNIGIDSSNIWNTIDAIPGGLAGLKKVITLFHKNKVKVYFPYMPWEVDTRRGNLDEATHWAEVIGFTDADGLFFDTWFDAGDFQKAIDKKKRGVSIGTEHHPTLQNTQGYYAITASWGQTLTPYLNNGISRVKWLLPEHLQWTINRWQTNRQGNLAYSWINGQGILVWENVFGHMNTWNAKDRQDLRKMNAIYQQFGPLYTSDSWKPYLPSGNAGIHISSWQNSGARIWNVIADKEDIADRIEIKIEDESMRYFDLWTGESLKIMNHSVTLPLHKFSCLIALQEPPSPAVKNLLQKQRMETGKALPVNDLHMQYLLVKDPKPAPATSVAARKTPQNLLLVNGGEYHFKTEHLKRESDCYPDARGKDNYDNKVIRNSFGNDVILHETNINLPAFDIMTRVVTNGMYQEFIRSTGYKPADGVNYLLHWKGIVCPDSMLHQPVVYVGLDDARAYAKWAGMRLPTEWEWQAAGETNKEFIYNEVWEWNESERFDGHNYFVTLRGGCKNWTLQTSRWYFPGSATPAPPGGSQPVNSHSKYFIMKTGFDRAATLGFRCMRPQ